MNYIEIYNQALSESSLGNNSKAIELFNAVKEYFITNSDFYSARGKAFADLARYEESITDYTSAINLDPAITYVYFLRAKSFSDLRRYDDAITDISHAIELAPFCPRYYQVRGEIYIHMDNYLKALDDFDFVIMKEPENLDVKVKYLYLWQRVNDGYCDFMPTTSEEFMRRGIAKFYKQLYEEAILDFNTALDKDQTNHYAYKSRGLTYMLMGDYNSAIKDFFTALGFKPCAEYLDNLGDAYQRSGDLESALKYFDIAVEYSNTNARIIYNRGVVHLKAHNLQKTIDDFSRAIELDQNFPDPYKSRSWCYNQLGMIDEAVQDMARYIELKEKYQLGLV